MDFNAIKSRDGAGNERYKVETTTYPLDLFGNDGASYGRSWLMININVPQNSKYLEDHEYQDWWLSDAENEKLRANIINARQLDMSPNAAALSVGGSTAVVSALGNFFARGDLINSAAVGAKAGAAAGLAVGLVTHSAKTASRETKRLKEAIQLPMPNGLSVNYSADWSTESTHMFDMMVRAGKIGTEALTNIVKGGVSSLNENLGKVFDGGTEALAATALRGAGVVGGGLSVATGLAANPKKEMMFDGVQHRTFSIGYTLYPKSLKEALAIRKIIYLMKYHMHPEYKSENRYTFIYPSEFDLTFFTSAGTENQFVSRISTCALTGLSLNYTPDGLWANFREGVPNIINLALTFQELGIHTKESIAKGF